MTSGGGSGGGGGVVGLFKHLRQSCMSSLDGVPGTIDTTRAPPLPPPKLLHHSHLGTYTQEEGHYINSD